ncbi:MAG: DUF6249 domain-containing protein [Candidatus Electryonea clarkiae]|nr:DUF6249 domain-containing protein [Candidatus Electryonea clarkiae]MDP8288701.1 DUF6249 domain-containing protein [Candidatus Electryonea clarkiae]
MDSGNLALMIPIIGQIIGIIAFLAVISIFLFAINRKYKINELEHKERMLAIEKGQPLPMRIPDSKPKSKYPFTWSFVLIGFGFAITAIYFIGGTDIEALGFGLVALFVGAGLFASRYYGVRKENSQDSEHAEIAGKAVTSSFSDENASQVEKSIEENLANEEEVEKES